LLLRLIIAVARPGAVHCGGGPMWQARV